MDDYEQLEKVVTETIRQSVDGQKLNFGLFMQRIEEGFTQFGFREKSARGGVENILILRLDAVGDLVVLSPAIRELRMNYPFARITLVVSKNVYPMAELCPYVNEVLDFDTNFDENNLSEILRRITDFAKNFLWKRHFDLVVNFHYWQTYLRLFMTYLSGGRERVGYIINPRNPAPKDKDVSYLLLTRQILNHKKIVHDCARSLYILKNLGLQINSTEYELWYNAEDWRRAKNLLEGFAPNRVKIVAGIGANYPARKYPVEKYLVAFKKIISKGAAIILLGGPSEIDDAKFLEENLPTEYVKNLVTVRAGWRVDAAVISQADMYIGNATGACDVAAAAKKPVIVLCRVAKDKEPQLIEVGAGEFANFFPWQTYAIFLRPKHALGECAKTFSLAGCLSPTPHCITQIKPDEIIAAYNEMIHFIKFSGIKKINCPPIIRSIDQITPLQFGFEFDDI